MSIPPLVCSTPPPPDQCDDEKEQYYFDLNYSMSQDDDDDEGHQYGYHTTFQSTETAASNMDIKPQETSHTNQIQSSKVNLSRNDSKENIFKDQCIKQCGTISSDQKQVKIDEDNNIEDLGLKLGRESDTSKEISDDALRRDLDKDSVIAEVSPTVSGQDTSESSPSLSSGLDMSFSETVQSPELEDKPQVDQDCDFNKTLNSNDDEVVTIISKEIILGNSESEPERIFDNVFQHVVTEVKLEEDRVTDSPIDINKEHKKIEQVEFQELSTAVQEDDEFGDFDDFQFADVVTKTPITPQDLEDVNPWGNETQNSPQTFGEFHANFDNVKEDLTCQENETSKSNIPVATDLNQGDDDFGDFDDFKSSAEVSDPYYEDKSLHSDMTMINLQSQLDESQYIDNIIKVLQSVYQEEILEPPNEFSKNLESSLCETWGHLLDTEVRQPYMVTWNNSIGQKTLLRALCIDSRNILFGPKWGHSSHNMPRFALNVGGPVLQPQKQSCPNVSQSDSLSNEKQMRAADTWTDPFSASGQESCNPDSEAQPTESRLQRTSEVQPTMLKTEKIYPNSLNIQPLRQINLPDTHIYTPTDSETPRSKTIHYDSGPPIAISHMSKESKDINDKTSSLESSEIGDSEYSDFQDFKGASSVPVASTDVREVGTAARTITYQTQTILQPVKLEVTMPTLNWPDPGEVKETFDDYSDFVANSSWFTDKKEIKQIEVTQNKRTDNGEFVTSDNFIKNLNPGQNIALKENTVQFNGFDDEFDTFQSAGPSHETAPQSNNTNTEDKSLRNDPLNFELPQLQTIKLNQVNTQFPNTGTNVVLQTSPQTKAKEVSQPEVSPNIPMIRDNEKPKATNSIKLPSGVLPTMNSQMLQPLPPTVSQNMQSVGQILQPLSLESISQINWPNPGFDLQDLSRFNPLEKVHSLNMVAGTSGGSKSNSPAHASSNISQLDDDGWGDFVSSKPKHQTSPKKQVPAEDDEWSDFVSSPSIRNNNGLNTISLNVHTNLNIQKTIHQNKYKQDHKQIDIPSLNYVTPKSTNYRPHNKVSDQHFQNL